MNWTKEDHEAVTKTLAVVCDATSTDFSQPTRVFIVGELGAFPAQAVLTALKRCSHEVKGRLSLADIIGRIDDGRPGAEEAWASFPKDERMAGVVTNEMSIAWGAACDLYQEDDVGARMAFKEAYQKAVTIARGAGAPIRWSLTAGWDRAATEAAAIEGLKSGRLTERQAANYALPEKIDAAMGRLALPTPQELANQKRLAGMLK